MISRSAVSIVKDQGDNKESKCTAHIAHVVISKWGQIMPTNGRGLRGTG